MTDIVGYTVQSTESIAAINAIKETELMTMSLINSFFNEGAIPNDKRWMSIAKTNIQQGFMAAVRAVAKPNGD